MNDPPHQNKMDTKTGAVMKEQVWHNAQLADWTMCNTIYQSRASREVLPDHKAFVLAARDDVAAASSNETQIDVSG